MDFDSLFSDKNSNKSNYLARLLGIFSENIVGFWAENEKCDYENLGRPSIYDKAGKKLAILDFTLKHKEFGRCFIVEQKNLIAYKNGNLRHMCDDESFLKAFGVWSTSKTGRTRAWRLFLGDLSDYTIKVRNEKLPDGYGRILIWSKFDIESKIKISSLSSIDEFLSFEQIHNDLIDWNDTKYFMWLDNRLKWTNELFKHLKESSG